MKVQFIIIGCFLYLSGIGQSSKAQPKKTTSKVSNKPKQTLLSNLPDSASYAIGVNIAKNLQSQGFTGIDALKLYKGMSDILLGKTPILNESQAANCINQYQQKYVTGKPKSTSNTNTTSPSQNPNNSINEAAKNKVLGREFLENNAKKPGIISMPGGWQYEVLKLSDDTTRPKFEDKVTFHYTVSDIDGKLIQSSKANNRWRTN